MLGFVQACIGRRDQRQQLSPVCRKLGHARRDGEARQRVALTTDVLTHLFDHAQGGGPGCLGQQQDELLATPAPHAVGLAHAF